MSIPVINKVKILAQISPHLAPLNSMASQSQEPRGSVVAVEGMDATTVFSMTNSLAEELERDGKFVVRIFGGPDPYEFRDENGRVHKRLSIAETLGLIGEWHKISEGMKRFISTRPSPTSEAGSGSSGRTKSVTMAEQLSSSEARKTPDPKTPEDVVVVKDPSSAKPREEQGEQTTTSILSAGTASKAADIKLATPPSQPPQFGNNTRSLSGFASIRSSSTGDEAPYTRVPAAVWQARPTTPPSSSRSDSTTAADTSGKVTKHFDTAPPPRSASISSQPITPSTAVPVIPSTPTTSTDKAANLAQPPPPSPGLHTGTPIPIALVPHYQLTTVDSAAITLPINDSYTPLAHWQWLATLWRGCLGPDVTIVIKGPNSGGGAPDSGMAAGEGGAASGKGSIGGASDAASAPNSGKETIQGASFAFEQPRDGVAAEASSWTQSGNPPVSGGSAGSERHPPTNPPSAGSSGAASSTSERESRQSQSQSQSVDVRLLECRTVVVRMNGFSGVGKDMTAATSSAEDRQNAQFWETAKRRVGFEVGEFLRR